MDFDILVKIFLLGLRNVCFRVATFLAFWSHALSKFKPLFFSAERHEQRVQIISLLSLFLLSSYQASEPARRHRVTDGQTGDKARMDLSLARTCVRNRGCSQGAHREYNYASGLNCLRPFISILRRLRGCVDIGRSSAVYY